MDFQVITNEYNELLQTLNINLRMDPTYIKTLDVRQNKMNRYMAHQLLRIRKYRTIRPGLA
jgi:hypothetical protein